MAFGYLSSRTSSSLLKTNLNIPLVLMLSILPDADILLRGIPFIQHRGATHSILSALILFAPFLIVYRKQAVPYFVALVQHGLVGDYIAGGRVQLFWPLTQMYFGISLDMRSVPNQAIEWTMFLGATILLLKMKDYKEFFKPKASNLILIVPTLTVLLPTLLSTPVEVPAMLIPPHVFYLIIFATAIVIEVFTLIINLFQISASATRQAPEEGIGQAGGAGLLPRVSHNDNV
jgi:membrane-bound metal-dependent hydrolase YbcI (DUF457 family)